MYSKPVFFFQLEQMLYNRKSSQTGSMQAYKLFLKIVNIWLRFSRRLMFCDSLEPIYKVDITNLIMMEAFDIFLKIVNNWLRFTQRLMFCDSLNPNYKVDLANIIAILVAFTYPIMLIRTIFCIDVDNVIEAISYTNVGLQVCPQRTFISITYNFASFINPQISLSGIYPLINRKRITKSLEFLINVYEQNRNNMDDWHIFNDFIKILKFCVQFIFVNFWLATIACSAYPALTYYFSNSQRVLPVPFYLPGTSPASNANSWLSYSLNLFYGLGAVCHGSAAYIFHDALLALQILHLILFTNILRHKIRILNEMVEMKQHPQIEIGVNLRNIILLYEEMNA